MHTSSHPSIMSTSFMSPITPLEVSRAAATHYAASSSALPLPSLSSWSLDHSCTTFKIAKAAGTIATATASATTTDTNTATSTNTPRHPKSTRLLEDDPDRDEEAHIRSFKRNRNQGMTLSPATPSKRRCYPMMLRLLGNNPNSGATMKSDHCDFGTKRWPNNNYYNQQQGFASFDFSADATENNDGNDAEILLPPILSRRPSQWPSFSSSFDPGQGDDNHGDSTKSSSDRETDQFPKACGSDEDDDESFCAPPPMLSQFRRNSTIRDSSDLASSIEEFCQSLVTS